MASQNNWRSGLSVTDRYNNVQKIEKAGQSAALKAGAFSLENDAYASSTSRQDYDAACEILSCPPAAVPEKKDGAVVGPNTGDQLEQSDMTIGQYENCHYLTSGVTSDVYRSGDRALKVITETRDMLPHDHLREVKILRLVCHPRIVDLLETFLDQEKRFVLVFTFMPLSLDVVLDKVRRNETSADTESNRLPMKRLRSFFIDIFSALAHIHSLGVIHRDIKPSAVLLASLDGPAVLSDFGTAWHENLAGAIEPAAGKILDIGTGAYRAPEALFGNQSYGPSVDMWASGAMLAECARSPPTTLFHSRPANEDGSQLGLILNIFQTIGTPTAQTWPEASSFKTPPFDMYRVFEPKPWEEILPDINPKVQALVSRLIRYDSSRATAEQALADIQKLDEEEAK